MVEAAQHIADPRWNVERDPGTTGIVRDELLAEHDEVETVIEMPVRQKHRRQRRRVERSRERGRRTRAAVEQDALAVGIEQVRRAGPAIGRHPGPASDDGQQRCSAHESQRDERV